MKSLLMPACLPIGACLLAAPLLAGCASGGTATVAATTMGQVQAPAEGRLAGRMVMEGGPMSPDGQQPPERPISGTVTITAPGHKAVTVKAGSSGRFSVSLPPGRYQLSGRSPAIMTVDANGHSHEQRCSQPVSATVTASHTATITLACIVP
jgi:hypothetical protein